MLTYLYIAILVCGFFWVGLYWGRNYRFTGRSAAFVLPPSLGLRKGAGAARRTERVDLEVPILVTGENPKGEKFNESTRTHTISGYGGAIVLKQVVKPGQEILISRADKSRSANARVLHELARSKEEHLYGVAFVDPEADLWDACELLTEAKKED